ncbi:zinc finger protein Xfin isoform X2 [Oncorhynchus kisutch]|uniref:zinc finger protein Xfin isoform X2 n=1 Tax=Oncorhynchus kisutch TaxID=8019 RepID=UPI0012DDC5D0|nr:zinc finger protein Xfin-like isoform X2 [Oncorhynchus kisutch]
MQHLKEKGPFLPPASMRLLVPPLRLVSAALWQVVQRRDVMDYGLVEEFVVTVLDVVPDLMSYREKVQLIMGLRAQLVLKLLFSEHLADYDTIQSHLNRMKTCSITHRDNQICDPEVEASESNFLKLIKTLLEDPVERERFFQNVFPEEFGPQYHSALQTLVWEFLSRLEKLLPTPTLQQTASWFLPDHSVLEQCEQSVRHPQPLRTLLQYHTNLSPIPHVEANALSSEDNHILSPSPRESSTDQADPEIQSEPIQTFMTIQSPASYCCESVMTPSLDYRESQRGIHLDRTANVAILPSNEEVDQRVNKETLDKESEMDQAFLLLRADSGPKIQPGAHRFEKEAQDVSDWSTSCRLRQPTVLLHRLDITDTLSPVSEVFPTPSRERLQIDNVETQGRRGERVVSQKSERNVDVEPSDSRPRYSLVPGPCRTKGQPKKSRRVKICSLCGETFREAKDLTAHITSHTEQRSYQYTLCSRQDVEHRDDLEKHRQNVCDAAAQPEEDNTSATSTRDRDISAPRHFTSAPTRSSPPRRGSAQRYLSPNQELTASKRKCTEISQPQPGAHRLEKEVQDVSNLCRTSTRDCTEISQPHDTLPQRRHKTTQHGKPRQSSKVTKRSVCDETFSKASHLGYTPGKLLNCGDVSENSTLKKHKKVCLKTKTRLSCSLCGDTFTLSEPNEREDVNPQQLPREALPEAAAVLAAVENSTEIPQPSNTTPQNPTTSNALPFQLANHYRKCLLCKEAFDNGEDLRRHLRFQHGVLPYLCFKCGESFQSTSDQKKHSDQCSGQNIPESRKCPGCRTRTSQCRQQQEMTSQEGNLKRHQTAWSPQHTGENEMETPQSSSTDVDFSNDSRQHRLNQSVDQSKLFVRCFFDQRTALTVSRSRPRRLNRCDETDFQTQQDFNEEVNPSQTLREVDPAGGGTSQPSRGNGIETPQPHSTESQNPTTCAASPTLPPGVNLDSRTCHVCSKSFRRKQSLILHLRRHGEGAINCPICSRCFGRNRDLKFHLANKSGCGPTRRNLTTVIVPTKDTPVFTCPECLQQFTSEKKLKSHMVCHTGDGFSCSFCGKMFAGHNQLKFHIRCHSYRPYLCDTCGKDFPSQSALESHERVHTDERAYSCTDCGKTFKRKGTLTQHRLIHTGERPFACALCQVRFTTNKHLKLHMMCHTGERPFKCPVCGRGFRQKGDLRQHQASCS